MMKPTKLFIFLLLFNFLFTEAQVDNIEVKTTVDNYSAQTKNTGILFLHSLNGKDFTYATGLADKGKNIKADPKDLFEIGSASKMFTAIAVLKLIEEGKLSLNTTMDKLFADGKYKALANYKGKNYWNKITVEMLLNHTSGMIDYLNVYEDDEKAMTILAVKGKVYTPDELVQLAIDHGDANFIPGEKFKYCNTGYILLGEIISKKAAMNWRDYIVKNIFNVAGMHDTYFGSRIPKEAENRKMTGYYNQKKSFMPPTLAGAAGEIVSNLTDLKKFLIAWQSGKLFKNPATLQMQHTQGYHAMYPDQTDKLQYGYGVMRIGGFYGHGGQTFGFQSYVTYNPEKKSLYVIGDNDAAVGATTLFFFTEGILF